jgi:hypothetical protein
VSVGHQNGLGFRLALARGFIPSLDSRIVPADIDIGPAVRAILDRPILGGRELRPLPALFANNFDGRADNAARALIGSPARGCSLLVVGQNRPYSLDVRPLDPHCRIV